MEGRAHLEFDARELEDLPPNRARENRNAVRNDGLQNSMKAHDLVEECPSN
jgi:hypothetical protein